MLQLAREAPSADVSVSEGGAEHGMDTDCLWRHRLNLMCVQSTREQAQDFLVACYQRRTAVNPMAWKYLCARAFHLVGDPWRAREELAQLEDAHADHVAQLDAALQQEIHSLVGELPWLEAPMCPHSAQHTCTIVTHLFHAYVPRCCRAHSHST
jgi:hypothetical protein